MADSRRELEESTSFAAFADGAMVAIGTSSMAEWAAAGAILGPIGWVLGAASLPALLFVAARSFTAKDSELPEVKALSDMLGITSSVFGTAAIFPSVFISPGKNPFLFAKISAEVLDPATGYLGAPSLTEKMLNAAAAEHNLPEIKQDVSEFLNSLLGPSPAIPGQQYPNSPLDPASPLAKPGMGDSLPLPRLGGDFGPSGDWSSVLFSTGDDGAAGSGSAGFVGTITGSLSDFAPEAPVAEPVAPPSNPGPPPDSPDPTPPVSPGPSPTPPDPPPDPDPPDDGFDDDF
jgi:hypothetical protein